MKLRSYTLGLVIGYVVALAATILIGLLLTGCDEGAQQKANDDNRFVVTEYGTARTGYIFLWHDTSNGNDYITAPRGGIIQVQTK